MNIKLFILLTALLLPPSCNLFAQRDSINYKGSKSIFIQLFGPEILGGHLNVNLNNRISLNAGLGIGAYHIGSNFYFRKKDYSQLPRFYIGIQIFSIRYYELFGQGFTSDREIGAYIPLGWEYINEKNNFSLQIDIGPNFSVDWGQVNTGIVNASIKFGKYFESKSK